jgi:NADH dehydrogenase FAD-containing subunit
MPVHHLICVQVDNYLRVKGVADGSVFALGDCCVAAGCFPTAQAASQQGKYLGNDLLSAAIVASKDVTYQDGCRGAVPGRTAAQ